MRTSGRPSPTPDKNYRGEGGGTTLAHPGLGQDPHAGSVKLVFCGSSSPIRDERCF